MSEWKQRKLKTWVGLVFKNIHTKHTCRIVEVSFCWIRHENLENGELKYTHYKRFKKHFGEMPGGRIYYYGQTENA